MVGGVVFFPPLLIYARIKSSFSVFPVVINPLRAPAAAKGLAVMEGPLGIREGSARSLKSRTRRGHLASLAASTEWTQSGG